VRAGLSAWHFECSSCDTEQAALAPAINAGVGIPDEHARAVGLAAVREAGSRRLLDALAARRPARRGALLDVGSGHGWFLSAVAPHFDRVVGIEPDDDVRAAPPGVEVRGGYFPAALRDGERFDVICFNDTFEHIPDPAAAARAAARTLMPGGTVVINLPIRHGAMYRASRAMHQAGLSGPFERMWQVGLPSPHLHYFSRRGLCRLFEDAGLRRDGHIRMPTLSRKGLWSRIRYAERRLLVAVPAYVGTLALAPLLRFLPADIEAFFFRQD
jgi:SAM-dependent methyltransferase